MFDVCRDYSSEVYAFGHRIGAPEVAEADFTQAFTNASFFTRRDVEGNVESAAPGARAGSTMNVSFLKEKLSTWLKRYLRFHLSKAPEDLIEAVEAQLLGDEILAHIGSHIGVEHLLRTAEHPPSRKSLADAMRALAGVVADEKAKAIVIDFVVPQILDIDFADIFPVADPLTILTDLLKLDGVTEVEPRILRAVGEVSAEPMYVVGIYADKKRLVSQSAGETLKVALDMAAREGLLRIWEITSDRNCRTNLSLQSQEEVNAEPLNVIEAALRYRHNVEAVVGKSYTKRLRHKFSRGSLAKRSFRYLVKPKPYTVA